MCEFLILRGRFRNEYPSVVHMASVVSAVATPLGKQRIAESVKGVTAANFLQEKAMPRLLRECVCTALGVYGS